MKYKVLFYFSVQLYIYICSFSIPDIPKFHCVSHGILVNKNTVDDFKSCDKVELLKNEGTLLWKDIQNGNCFQNPSLLSRFFILSFAVSEFFFSRMN